MWIDWIAKQSYKIVKTVSLKFCTLYFFLLMHWIKEEQPHTGDKGIGIIFGVSQFKQITVPLKRIDI